MNGFLSPGPVHIVVAIAAAILVLDLAAAIVWVRDLRRSAARGALDRIAVPDASTALGGQPYADLKQRLIHAAGVDLQAGRP